MATFLSLAQIEESIRALDRFHNFFGTTFLVLKKLEAPVGATAHLALDAENSEHLRKYFRLHPKSDYFFNPFKIKRNETRWRPPNYASTSLQAVNTQSFRAAIIHTEKGRDWGWAPNYIDVLRTKLPRNARIPLLHLAVWMLRDVVWDDRTTRDDVVLAFVRDFNLTNVEVRMLFDQAAHSLLNDEQAFQESPPSWTRLVEGYGSPPDVSPDAGATLRYLEFSRIGPARELHLAAAPRLNLLTGDNGLGKTFLLDIVWWALTREWAEQMIVPLEPVPTPPQIKFLVATTPDQRPVTATFDAKNHGWRSPPVTAVTGLVVYARVDGSFAVWDPAAPASARDGRSTSFVNLPRDAVWKGNERFEGLLRDWVRWQTRSDEFPAFGTFDRVLQRMKPPDLGTFAIGKPVRDINFAMEIPTLVHPYGTVPIVYESAGIRRILTIAYLVVWAWENHKLQAKRAGRREERQMLILLDEAEAHLHPRWQRVLLPALLGIAQDLHEELAIQYFVASHSPLILASAEQVWDCEKDRLFHLRMDAKGKVVLDAVPFELRGTADAWLQSPSFDGLHPGSEAAELALRHAKALMEGTPSESDIRAASERLAAHLATDDPFWLRWILFAGQHGVEL